MHTYHGPKDRVDAARSLETPAEELAKLASSEAVFVREAVAANPNTPITTLKELLPSELKSEADFRLATAIASNTEAGASFMDTVCELLLHAFSDIAPRDYYPSRLIDTVASCPGFTPELASRLLDPETCPKHIRGRIASSNSNPVLLTKLLDDPSGNVRSRAERSLNSQE